MLKLPLATLLTLASFAITPPQAFGAPAANAPAASRPATVPGAPAAAGAAATGTSAANQSTYNVEILVFRNGSGGGGDDAAGSGARALQGGGDETSGGAAQVGHLVGVLPAAQFQLSADQSRLQAAGYSILAHVAWSQSASSWGSRAGFTLARLGVQSPGLSGIVYLERGAYLHLGMSVRYNGGGGSYEIAEMRRVKFYEQHYFDHPGLGVIALVTPTQGARSAGR